MTLEEIEKKVDTLSGGQVLYGFIEYFSHEERKKLLAQKIFDIQLNELKKDILDNV